MNKLQHKIINIHDNKDVEYKAHWLLGEKKTHKKSLGFQTQDYGIEITEKNNVDTIFEIL